MAQGLVSRREALASLRPFLTPKRLSKQQRSKIGQVRPPHHPCVGPGRFDVNVMNAFGGEPCPQRSIDFDQVIIGSTSNPEQSQLSIGTCFQAREFLFKIRRDSSGAECTDPSKLVQVI